MFKLSTIYIDTASQSPAPLSDHIVNHMLAQLFPFLHNPLMQFTNILDYVVIYKEYIICPWTSIVVKVI